MGPSVGLFLRNKASELEIQPLVAWIKTITPGVRTEDRPWMPDALRELYWSFEITDGSKIGLPGLDCSELGSMSIGISQLEEWTESAQEFIDQIGYFPEQEISVMSTRKKDGDHRVVSQLALQLGELFDGLYDMGSSFYPPMQIERVDMDQWALQMLGFSNRPPYVYDGPGKIYEIHYTTVNNVRSYFNVVDKECFRARVEAGNYSLIT
jgi:Family of unknown function (DUF6368)